MDTKFCLLAVSGLQVGEETAASSSGSVNEGFSSLAETVSRLKLLTEAHPATLHHKIIKSKVEDKIS